MIIKSNKFISKNQFNYFVYNMTITLQKFNISYKSTYYLFINDKTSIFFIR
jgi:hypothetical protein